MPKVFISYSSKEPDAGLAKTFNNLLLQKGIQTFYAPINIEIGEEWSRRISEEIQTFDYFLVLLSENSLSSDMVAEEIRRAVLHFQNAEKKPGILPVRVNLEIEKFINYDIDSYLRPFQHRIWKGEQDTTPIINEIIAVIEKNHNNLSAGDDNEELFIKKSQLVPTGAVPAARPNAPIVFTGGMLDLDCPYYVVRKQEKDNISYIKEPGALIRIFAPRQYGKTSLLARINVIAKQTDHEIIAFNFQLHLEEKQMQSLDTLLMQLCILIGRCMGFKYKDFKDDLNEIWDTPNNSKLKFEEFLETFVLNKSDKNIVFAIDEADRLFRYPEVSSDFFGMLRAWHENAKQNEKFERIKIIVVHSTEAYLANVGVNQSPFANVGCEIKLPEFSPEEMKSLSVKYELQLGNADLDKITEIIGGHPYLTGKAFSHLYNQMSPAELIKTASLDNGPFGDHLKRIYQAVSENEEAFDNFKNILRNGRSGDNKSSYRLKAAGLVEGEFPNLKVKLPIYKEYFKSKI